MKTIQSIFALVLILALNTFAQDAQSIISKSDAVVNAPKDMHQFSRMILIDKDGDKKVRKAEMFQKGDEKRLVRFLSPADQKGIGFLSLPDDVMYLYLPAFHKIRRIASHVKNENFAGTDFSYDDMSSFKYSEEYNAKLLETKDDVYVLELTPKSGIEKDYSKLVMEVRKDNFYPVKIDFYDKAGNLWKVMTSDKIEKNGNYWVSMKMQMKDLKKNHSTIMITDSIEFDTGISNKVFTKRNLKKIR